MPETANRPLVKKDPEDVVRSVTKVASLPTIFTKLDEAINDPRKTNKDFAKIINEDTAMAARLLRIANSALYNFPSKIETVTHAVTIIGTNQLRDLVLASSVIKLFANVPEDLVSMESFWRHSIACGLTARTIATVRRETNVERFFVAGLLHDIGRLIMYMEFSDAMGQVIKHCAAQPMLMFKAEKELLGFDHAKLGALLINAWKLPARLEEAVGFHHSPMSAKRFPAEAAVIHAADIIANAMQLGSSGETRVPPLNEQSWQHIDLPPSAIGSIVDQLEVQYADAVNFITSD